MPLPLTRAFVEFFESEKAGAVLLLACTGVSLTLANSPAGHAYLQFWQISVAGLSLEHWINDGLMAVFFLLIGLELERELYVGELSSLRNALLPICAAIGGIAVPAGLHFYLNAGTPTQAGAGIPMATDIAFALGALALLGKRVPGSLMVFLTALAVMDDLGAILVIAAFYSTKFSLAYLCGALAVFLALVAANVLRVMSMLPYLIGGALMWFLMLKSGVHATIAGVLLAFAIPFNGRNSMEDSPSHRMEHRLHRPVVFGILPLFALANTGVVFEPQWLENLVSANSLGILGGLTLGKPLGIFLFSYIAVSIGLCRLPDDLGWRHIAGVGCLGGIGFTMSIFITNLAFGSEAILVSASKIAILAGSLIAGLAGVFWLLLFSRSR
jgi:Na+:H+ antiporter, NhaA family